MKNSKLAALSFLRKPITDKLWSVSAMTLTQQIITIALCVLGTQLTRFVPFLIFNEHRKTPHSCSISGKFCRRHFFDAGRLLPEIRLLPPLRRGLFFII